MKTILILLFFLGCSSLEKDKPVYFINPNPPSTFEKLAEAISRKEEENQSKTKKVIVLNFSNIDGKEHSMGKVFAEKLTTELVKQKKFIVLDRMVYARKISDAGLSLSGSVEPGYLKKLGEVLNVDFVVVGIIIPAKTTGYDVNARLLEIKTGLILAAEEAAYAETTE
jgi:TolB-like protein